MWSQRGPSGGCSPLLCCRVRQLPGWPGVSGLIPRGAETGRNRGPSGLSRARCCLHLAGLAVTAAPRLLTLGRCAVGAWVWGRHAQLLSACRFLRYQEALSYLVYAYQSNAALLTKGPRRGVKESVIALYRRKCLLVRPVWEAARLTPPSAPSPEDVGLTQSNLQRVWDVSKLSGAVCR